MLPMNLRSSYVENVIKKKQKQKKKEEILRNFHVSQWICICYLEYDWFMNVCKFSFFQNIFTFKFRIIIVKMMFKCSWYTTWYLLWPWIFHYCLFNGEKHDEIYGMWYTRIFWKWQIPWKWNTCYISLIGFSLEN